ncbi:MAG: hypothetical protein ACYTGC_03010, partial [Planctomycetota bacterium]
LGVGCSDPYSSFLNGDQDGLGPKFEVNAYTGAYEWVPTDFDVTGDSIYKRLQVSISDLDPAQDGGGTYIAEAQYVAADDSAAGNQFNNVSWRLAEISGAGVSWNMGLTGQTQRMEPAIRAWADSDPLVSLRTANVPGDGRFYLAWRITTVGVEWLYELALYNMNVDRSAGLVRIALPPGTTVSSSGFHDVDYHSGEPYDDTDWPATVANDQITWQTSSWAVDPNANALRWGTLYNFRFVADAPPSQIGSVEIGLFKPGEPSSIDIPLIPDPPANDGCQNPITISSGITTFTTISATTDGPDDTGCAAIDADVWFQYVSPCTGDLTIDLCGSGFDTSLAVYGPGCPSADTALACDDNACGEQSSVTVAISSGQLLLIRVGSPTGDQGVGAIELTCDGVVGSNDDCADAFTIVDGDTPYDTTGASTDGPVHSSCQFDGQTYNDIWYHYTALGSGDLTVSTCGNAVYDSDLVVYDGCDCGDLQLLGCSDDADGCPNFSSEVTVPVVTGGCYLIRVGGWNAANEGPGTLEVSGPPPDDCNGNGVPDVTDIRNGTSQDCNGNSVPDECDIADGTSEDANGNGVPDACECPDTNRDGIVDVNDLLNVILDWSTDGSANGGDVDGSGLVDVNDLLDVVLAWGSCL